MFRHKTLCVVCHVQFNSVTRRSAVAVLFSYCLIQSFKYDLILTLPNERSFHYVTLRKAVTGGFAASQLESHVL